MDIIVGLNIMLVVLVVIIIALVIAYYFLVYKNKIKQQERDVQKETKQSKDFNGIPRETTDKLLDFDEIKDDMIIRKNRQQYVMVIQCKGINYDLLSEEEKESVESGFVEFLNTIRFPIQLYVQTRSLNLRKTIEGYKEKVGVIADEIKALRKRREELLKTPNSDKELDMIEFEIRRKENVLEYGQDISNYIGRMSLNQNVLQQKTYVVVSYFKSELGNVSNYSKDEIINMVFTELYTRAQTLIRSLASAQVSGRILNSEELSELLYIAYNRDEEQIYQLDRALDAQYDALYSTAKDVLEKRKERIDNKIDDMAVDLASDSLIEADNILKNKEQLNNELRERTIAIIEEYKNQLAPDLYNETKKIIEEKTKQEDEEINEEENKEETPAKEKKRTVSRGRPKKTEKN